MNISGPSNIGWLETEDGVKLSDPALITSGYEMRVLYLPKETSYQLQKGKTIVNLLRGKLKSHDFGVKEATIASGEKIDSLKDSLLFLCHDVGDNGKIQDDISGINLKWLEVASGCIRTEPKIEVDDYKINLWYLLFLHESTHYSRHSHTDSWDFFYYI